MTQEDTRTQILDITQLAAQYCASLENAREAEKKDFIVELLDYLPRLYWQFSNLEVTTLEENDFSYLPSYVDEDYYENIRRNVETLMGADDIFLETFEEDMKYSDTPVSASISESLADIFQSLFNFVSVIRDSEGENAVEAYCECHENFECYWSQTLCNVMRALNRLRYHGTEE